MKFLSSKKLWEEASAVYLEVEIEFIKWSELKKFTIVKKWQHIIGTSDCSHYLRLQDQS